MYAHHFLWNSGTFTVVHFGSEDSDPLFSFRALFLLQEMGIENFYFALNLTRKLTLHFE